MLPNIIALDFDRTLFDTERFKIALAKSLRKHGIAPEIWWETYKCSIPRSLQRYQIYRPEIHAKLIQKITGVKKEAILNSFHKVISQTSKFIFKETKPVLEFLKNKKYTLCLVSFGNKPHQKEKIKNSGIVKYFDKIIISQKPKASIKFPELYSTKLRNHTKVRKIIFILVDDNILEIENLYKKYKNKICLVWLNRENKKTKLPISIIQIKNLKSLIKLHNSITL